MLLPQGFEKNPELPPKLIVEFCSIFQKQVHILSFFIGPKFHGVTTHVCLLCNSVRMEETQVL